MVSLQKHQQQQKINTVKKVIDKNKLTKRSLIQSGTQQPSIYYNKMNNTTKKPNPTTESLLLTCK